MRKTNWASVEKSTKNIKKAVKNLQKAGVFFKELPEDGYMIDEKKVKDEDGSSKKVIVKVLIKECKSSTLRRFIRQLDNYYYLVSSESDRKRILNKKIEIESELNKREDGLK